MKYNTEIIEREKLVRAQRDLERMERDKTRKEVIWKDRKRSIFGLPWTFTKYTLTGEKLIIETGFIHQHRDVVQLYRIKDVSLSRSLRERIFGLGTINCISSDASLRNFDIKRIKCSLEVFETLSDMVEMLRRDMKVGVRDYMGEYDEDGDGDGGFMFF